MEVVYNAKPLSFDSAIDSAKQKVAWVHEQPSLKPKLIIKVYTLQTK